MPNNLIYFAAPTIAVLMLVEWRLLSRGWQQGANLRGYERHDSTTNLSLAVIASVANIGWKAAALAAMLMVAPFALFDIGFSDYWAWPLVLLCEDFFYYWYHRFVHRTRLGWAAHVTHHSSEYFNLTTALRQPLTTQPFKILFVLPVVIIGFDPLMVAVAIAINRSYQYWIHTEVIGKVGPLEWLFNTASHHRVHHGRNPQYIDRNYGGVLIIWDRLFGTFTAENEPVNFGLVKPLKSHNIVWVSFHEVVNLWNDLRNSQSWRERGLRLMKPPGWEPNN